MNKIQISEKLINDVKFLYYKGLRRKEIANTLAITEWAVRLAMKSIAKIPGLINKINKSHTLTDQIKQCILGSLLGDASLSYRHSLYHLQISHSVKQLAYINHIASILHANVVSCTRNNSFSKDKIFYKINYQNKGLLEKIANIVFINNHKYVNKNWLDNLTLEGISYWYMDDGCSSWRRNKTSSFVRFSTLAFNDDEIDLLVNKLKTFNLNPRINKHINGKGKIIALSGNDSQYFYKLIDHYIIPSMKYKLKSC